MATIKRVIFVCTDNTCRSLMAELVMKSVLKKRPLEVLSRGLVVLFPEPINPKAVAILKAHQLEPERTASVELGPEDIVPGTLILTMTRQEAARVQEMYGERCQSFDIGTFIGRAGDIEDPCGGSLADYGASYEYIDLAVKLAAEIIFKENDAKETEEHDSNRM